MSGILALAFFGSFFWFCVITGLILIMCFISENVKQGGLAFTGLVIFLLVNYFWGNVPVMDYVSWMNTLAYFGVGFVYAILKTIAYGSKSSNVTRDITYLKGNVFRWWFIWPVSLLNWIFSDLMKDLFNFLYTKLKGTFEYFFYLGVGKKIKQTPIK